MFLFLSSTQPPLFPTTYHIKMSKRAYSPDEQTAPPTASPNKRPKTTSFNPNGLAQQGFTFSLPSVIEKLRTKSHEPWSLGAAIGVLLYHISPLIATRLDNAIDYQNAIPSALAWAPTFVAAIDQHIAHLRLTDGCSGKFPAAPPSDRKIMEKRRKYLERYVYIVEAAYKAHIRASLADVFHAWDTQQTQQLNKGVDKALTRVQWVVYPDENVVFEAVEGDWAVWIRGRCEELGTGHVA
jgi:hypothetical protein